MKLVTDIKPNSAGIVIAEFGAITYQFVGTPLECDVADDDHIAHLINTGNFYPADAADFPAAESKIISVIGSAEIDDDDDAVDENDEIVGGLPVEALTPIVKNKTPRKAK